MTQTSDTLTHWDYQGRVKDLMMWDNQWLTSEIPSPSHSSPSPHSGQVSPMVCDISECDHRPHRPVLGPGATSGHCLVLILAFIQPLQSWVPGAACHDHPGYHSLSPSNNTLDKYWLDVSLSRLWSLMPPTLLSPDSWEHVSLHVISASFRIVSDRKSHFTHDNVPDWRLLINRRLGPLNQCQWAQVRQ